VSLTPKDPYKVVHILPQDLIDLAAALLTAHETAECRRKLWDVYGISEDRLGELAIKMKKEVDRV
jgi:hypothetical protein